MLSIVAIVQFKVLDIAQKRSGLLYIICFLSWVSAIGVFLIEMSFSSSRNYNTLRRLSTDLNIYLMFIFILLCTVYLDYMIQRL